MSNDAMDGRESVHRIIVYVGKEEPVDWRAKTGER